MSLKGYILDVYPDYEHNQITSWIKSGKACTRVTDEFYPRFYVHASSDKLRKLVETLKFLSSVEALEYKHRRIDLVDPKLYKVLEVTMNDYQALRELAEMIDKNGKYSDYQLFNVDLRLYQKYMF